jgi:cobalamin-dependent methionine synthase I
LDIIQIPVEIVAPTFESVLRAQGVPAGSIDDRMRTLAERAISRVLELAEPQGMCREISMSDFAELYRGEGKNALETPLGFIYGQSDRLALYAVTLGRNVSDAISRQFEKDDFVEGAMLDAAASEATDLAAGFVESWYRESLSHEGIFDESMGVLQFSPGYCGWHISGQKRLFDSLKPGNIGITLSESFLMDPLKSISGVLVAGKREIFVVEDNYPFCSDCRIHSCQTRIRAIVEQLGDDWT